MALQRLTNVCSFGFANDILCVLYVVYATSIVFCGGVLYTVIIYESETPLISSIIFCLFEVKRKFSFELSLHKS